MKFRRARGRDEPEINFVPLIDVLLVILIFLMATTTYSRFAELKINLPTAAAEKGAEQKPAIEIAISATGQYVVNQNPFGFKTVEGFALALRRAAGSNPDPMIVVNADGQASHQSVVNVMEAARAAGFARLTFATQAPANQ